MIGYLDLVPKSKYCYVILNEELPFVRAIEACADNGSGELASITSKDMQELIDAERKRSNVNFMWIGLMKPGKIWLLEKDIMIF